MPGTPEEISTGTIIDNRIIAAVRLVLAVFALLLVFSLAAAYNKGVVYVALGAYIVYGGVFYLLTLRRSVFAVPLHRWPFWVDLGWYVLLMALSGGPGSVIYFFLYFFILVTSFQWGASDGLKATAGAVVGYTVASVAPAVIAPDANITWSQYLPRASYLLLLGYVLAYWGGHEVTLKRRLLLLKEITTFSNPRFGTDRTIGTIMEQIRDFYDADACLLVAPEPATNDYYLRRADRKDPERAIETEPLVPQLSKQLLALPDDLAVTFSGEARSWWRLRPSYHAVELTTRERTLIGEETSRKVARLLDADSFASVPVRYRNTDAGRLFLISRQRRTFNDSDVDFLVQIIEHITPIIDNIRLIDQLASTAAEAERQRIARDLHDSVIQPYIGLQMGLNAVQQKLAGGDDVTHAVERLLETTNVEISELRRYVHGLKESGTHTDDLVPAVKRFAHKFSDATGIAVDVDSESDFRINGRAAAEAFQIIVEGLSNVRKHTHAGHAKVLMKRENDFLVLQIANEVTEGDRPVTSFRPRSIEERAASLGGHAHVEQQDTDSVVVEVSIPL